MRELNVAVITDAVEKMSIDANLYLNNDMCDAFAEALRTEDSDLGKNVMEKLLENADIARNEQMPICQDTGMAVVFVDIGQDVHLVGGNLTDAINEGVRRGYEKGYLRKSVVADPINRINTKDNTPAVIHYNIVPGDKVKITVAPKGFGSENMSALKMLTPSAGLDGVMNFVVETVKNAGPNPCPPIVVGVGVGGTMEQAAICAKRSLLRNLDDINPDTAWREVEETLLKRINELGIGPAGLGGKNTALAVKINPYATHIAGLPVAVNINCHATRHVEMEV